MLHGIRRDLQQQLVREGYALRVYIPFGSEWYPYFMRRLAERPRMYSSSRGRCSASKQWLVPLG